MNEEYMVMLYLVIIYEVLTVPKIRLCHAVETSLVHMYAHTEYHL